MATGGVDWAILEDVDAMEEGRQCNEIIVSVFAKSFSVQTEILLSSTHDEEFCPRKWCRHVLNALQHCVQEL
eukprot:6074977-Prorocentrum_lima.AAC.1